MIDHVFLQLHLSDEDAECLAFALDSYSKNPSCSSHCDVEFCDDLSSCIFSLLNCNSLSCDVDATLRYTAPSLL